MFIRIGTRGSDLALWQANIIKKRLEKNGNIVCITIIKTQGDKVQDLGFDKIEGKGFFTKEIEYALLLRNVDLAVHSQKDLETIPKEGLIVAAVSEREDPSELLLMTKESVDLSQVWELKLNSTIGTSSARRKSLIVSQRSDLIIKDLRGNVPTRIQKLREGYYDSIILAKAGVSRLDINLDEFHVVELNPKFFVPAPSQGVLALQIRENEPELLQEIKKLNHPLVEKQVLIERKVLNLMNGGCQLPLGVYCDFENIYISYAKEWSSGANLFCFPYSESANLAQNIVDTLKRDD
ncbi:MAG: hydroxymethylbilane synthase [Bacteroidota bacterium]